MAVSTVAVKQGHDYWAVIRFIEQTGQSGGTFTNKVASVGKLVDA